MNGDAQFVYYIAYVSLYVVLLCYCFAQQFRAVVLLCRRRRRNSVRARFTRECFARLESSRTNI